MEPLFGLNRLRAWLDTPRSEQGSVCAEAMFDGVVGLSSRGVDDVARLLPPDLQLATRCDTPSGTHPLAFVLGTQSETAVYFGGLRLPTDLRFHELLVAVPDVVGPRSAEPCTFVVRMYATDVRSTWPGNAFYGFEKQLCSIQRGNGEISAELHGGERALASKTIAEGPWETGSEPSGSDADRILSPYRRPILGRRRDGSYAVTSFAWRFDEARHRRSSMSMNIYDRALPSLAGAELDMDAGNAFEIRNMRWGIGWPKPIAR